MAKRPNLFKKHYYIRLNKEECETFFELLKGTTLENETFLKRKSTPGTVYVYRKAGGYLRGEPYRDWRRITSIMYQNR